MIKIAILGFGVVGQGVYDVITTNSDEVKRACGDEVEIKYVLDKLSFPGHALEKCVVTDMQLIVADPEISVVVETMGGEHPAYDFSRLAIENGKSVVTSNKLVVDKRGRELEELAARHGVCYMYEASVGGGIPLIHTAKNCLDINKIQSITGILNGTTNFILNQIESEGMSFDDALKLAQQLGYAEKDPSADINGFDTARKISILATIMFGEYFAMEDCALVEGIGGITPDDIALAAQMDCKIKLVGVAQKRSDGRVALFVSPCFVDKNTMLASVSGVFNAVNFKGNMVGDVLIYGQGAGSQATASAVVSDIAEIARIHPKPLNRQKAGASRVVSACQIDLPAYVVSASDLGTPIKVSGNQKLFAVHSIEQARQNGRVYYKI